MLAWSTNLGHVDVYPATSGKRNAGLYLAAQLLKDDSITLLRPPTSAPPSGQVGQANDKKVVADKQQQQGQSDTATTTTSDGYSQSAPLEAVGAATAFLCDDDNDLGLASSVGLVLVPQCTAVSVATAANANAAAAASAAAAHRTPVRISSPDSTNSDAAVEGAAISHPPEFLVAPVGGALGTEWCLRNVLARTRAL